MKVIYNGGTSSYRGCSNPACLVCGKVYEVIRQKVGDSQTNYILKGIEGKFNSVWFDPVLPTYFAFSDNIPVVGTRYECTKLIFDKDDLVLQKVRTATIQKVEVIGKDTCKVTTSDIIYVVNLKSK